MERRLTLCQGARRCPPQPHTRRRCVSLHSGAKPRRLAEAHPSAREATVFFCENYLFPPAEIGSVALSLPLPAAAQWAAGARDPNSARAAADLCAKECIVYG